MDEYGFSDLSSMLDPGVYALLLRGIVVYVGKSKLPLQRIAFHLNQKKSKGLGGGKAIKTTTGVKYVSHIPFDEVWLKNCSLDELNSLERQMIQQFNPRYNVRMNNNAGYNAVNYQNILLPNGTRLVDLVLNREPGVHPTIGKIERRI